MIYLIFLISMFFHELGHITIASILGYKIKNLHIFPLGAKINIEENVTSRNSSIKKIIIYFAGPAVNFIICLCFLIYNCNFRETVIYSNVILALFNLLPLIPFDGGNILREFLKIIIGNNNGIVLSYNISKVFLVILTLSYSLLILEFKNISLFFIIVYLWIIDIKEYKNVQMCKRAYKVIEKSKGIVLK